MSSSYTYNTMISPSSLTRRRWSWPIILVGCLTPFHILLLTRETLMRDYLQYMDDAAPPVDLPSSLDTLCHECKQAMVGTSFRCADRIKRYLTSSNSNATSFSEAQTIVSREYSECSVCDPKTCRKSSASSSSDQEESASVKKTIENQKTTSNKKTSNKKTTNTTNTDFFHLIYRGDAGLGHRLIRMSSAYHLAKALNLSHLYPIWGWHCGRNENGDPDIFDHLFGNSPLSVTPSTEPIFSWINTTAKTTIHANDTRKRAMKFINEVPGYAHKLGAGAMRKAIAYGKQQSDVEFYSLLKERFRFNDEANRFMRTHAFDNFTMVGLHIRAGNGEKGDFARKGRGIDDLDKWISNVSNLFQNLANSSYYMKNNKPLKVFLATDTPSVLSKLMNATRDIEVIMFEQKRVEEGKGVSYFHKWEDDHDNMCHRGWVDQFMDMVLLTSCDMVVAGQYSSFTQSMPLSIMTAEKDGATNTTTEQSMNSGNAFCEIGEVGDMIKCYNNYTEWMLDYRNPPSLPIVGNSTGVIQKRHNQLKLTHSTSQDEIKNAFAGTVLEDYF